MSASTTPHDWRRAVASQIERDIADMRRDLADRRHIVDAQRGVRRLRGELEGRVHKAAYPYVYN